MWPTLLLGVGIMVEFVIVLSQVDTVVLILVAILVGLAFLVAAVAFLQWRGSRGLR